MGMVSIFRGIRWDYDFLKMPKFLFEEDIFTDLTSNAKLLYTALLDRSALSAKNGLCDKKNIVFVWFSLKEACELLRCSLPTAVKAYAELKEIGLIEKQKGRKGGPDKIFVKVYVD